MNLCVHEFICSMNLCTRLRVTRPPPNSDSTAITPNSNPNPNPYPNPNANPAQVRVVAVGGPGIGPMIAAPTTAEWAQYSTEFCGGTHVSNTAEIKSYALITEEGLGKVSLSLTLTLT